MPPLSDPPYPFNWVLSGFASTFERYQYLSMIRSHQGGLDANFEILAYGDG
jgi:hypothetical protein